MKKILTLLTLLLTFQMGYGQLTMTVQPSGGLNDGSDTGTDSTGKDAWVNRYAPSTNEGANWQILGSPRSNCNPSDYKAYFQFDVTDLPANVDSVFFGVLHREHTTYCYSNCDADFYFYKLTSAWDEMTIVQTNLPNEDTLPIYGPLNIKFPNDFKSQEYNITGAYNDWKANPSSNYGFTVYSPTVGCNNAAVTFNVHGSDDTVASNRPYLKIYYRFATNLEEIETSNALNVYPNPFNSTLSCDISNPDHARLIDLTGREYILEYDERLKGFNTTAFAPGLYVLQIGKDGKKYTSKVYKR